MAREIERDMLYMMPMRSGVGRAPFPEVAAFLGKQAPHLRNFAMAAISVDRESIRNDMRDLKSHVPPAENPTPAEPAALASWFLYAVISGQFVQRIKQATAQGDLPTFRFAFDYTIGLNGVFGEVIQAHGVLEGDPTGNERLRQFFTEADAIYGMKQVDTNLEVAGQRAAEAGRLLAEDPTGFLVVDRYVDLLKTKPSDYVDRSQSKGYVIAGAELGRDLYKEIYPLAVELYPEAR